MYFNKKTFLTILFFLAGTIAARVIAQNTDGTVTIEANLADSFSFTKQWDYRWDIFRDDATGEFIKNGDQPLTAADTAHLFFTAACSTNVQGGYAIRYCFTRLQHDSLQLAFSDGLPAYASEFFVSVKDGRFIFLPETVYPQSLPLQKITYSITRQKLLLNKHHYAPGNRVIGYIDVEFTESVTAQGYEPKQTPLFLRGWFCTRSLP